MQSHVFWTYFDLRNELCSKYNNRKFVNYMCRQDLNRGVVLILVWHFTDNFIKGFRGLVFCGMNLTFCLIYCLYTVGKLGYNQRQRASGSVSRASLNHAEKNAICAICVQSLQIFLCFVNDIAFVDFLSFSYDWHRSRLSGVLTASREFTRFWGGPDFCNCSPFCL